jgi:type IV secretory pathway TraG/TraD family ATPase VirD4
MSFVRAKFAIDRYFCKRSILSALDQGFPTIVYDFKYPKQTERISGYAAKRGYDVRVFAPGYPESEVCNPLEFLKDEADSLMARQFAEVMNRNFQLNKEGDDPFFTAAGDQLTEAILMLTKACGEYADLMTSQANNC